jgi:hypothetical protein
MLIEPQTGFAIGLIRPVALEAVVRKQRQNVSAEIDVVASRSHLERNKTDGDRRKKKSRFFHGTGNREDRSGGICVG